jgi:flagellar biosynthesis protein FliR
VVEFTDALAAYLLFGLVLIRCSGVAVFAPFFGGQQFPLRARIGLVFFFALLMYPTATADPVLPSQLNMPDLALLALQEISVGLVLGFISSMVFMGVQLGGQLVGQQIGFALANIVDPMIDRSVSIIGFLNMNLAVVIFLAANLHLLIIAALWKSYDYVQMGALVFPDALSPMSAAVYWEGKRMLVVALQLAMPILLVMLLNSVVVGFLTRTMPQMNIMVLGLPLRVALGLTTLMFMIPVIGFALDDGQHYLAGDKSGILYGMIRDLGYALEQLGIPPT